jgi:hypothetical protein
VCLGSSGWEGNGPQEQFWAVFFCESSSSCGTDCRIPSVPRHRIAPPLPPVDPHPCALHQQTHLRDRSRRRRSLPGTASPRIRGGACGSARARSSEEQEYSGGLVGDAGSHDSRWEEDPTGLVGARVDRPELGWKTSPTAGWSWLRPRSRL